MSYGHRGENHRKGYKKGSPGTGEFPALSIRQPWAWAIIHAGKRIENRTWRPTYTGPLWLHASKTCARTFDEDCRRVEALAGLEVPRREELLFGVFVGGCRLTGCQENTPGGDRWAVPGQYGLQLDDVWGANFILHAQGALNLWWPTLNEERLLLVAAHTAAPPTFLPKEQSCPISPP